MGWRKKSSLDWLRTLSGIAEGEPLESRTSFGIGGPAEFYVELGKTGAIAKTIEGCKEGSIPYLFLGAGTNLLIGVSGVEGLVLPCQNRAHQSEGTKGPA